MNIKISDKAYITDYPKEFLEKAKELLTITNPLFASKKHMNLGTWGVPQNLKYYEIKDKTLIIPLGSLVTLTSLFSLPSNFIDERTCNTNLDITFKGTLRPYQEDLVNAFNDRTMGLAVAMTGSGKTASFINLITRLKENTIILVNTIELANQTIGAIKKFTSLTEVGLIGNGKFEIQPVTVALHQSMLTLDEGTWDYINSYFGLFIADEVHIIAASTFFQNSTKIKSKYRFGFTATLNRGDGLTDLIHAAIGPTLHTVDSNKLTNNLVIPKIEYVKTTYYFPLYSTNDYVFLQNDLAENETRNALICTLRNQHPDKFALLLCNRETQVKYLHEQIPNSIFLSSKQTKKTRKGIMEDILNKKYTTVISTYSLFSTGIDVPHLDLMIQCAPIKSEIIVRQSAGRIMRKSPGKKDAIIIDLIDDKVELLKIQSYARKRIYKKLAAEFET